MKFTWDDEKNEANKKKHEISFEEASLIFDGSEEIEYDSDHSSDDEERFRAYGILKEKGQIVVVFVEIVDDLIRIISARKE